jgi:hypothetical protein
MRHQISFRKQMACISLIHNFYIVNIGVVVVLLEELMGYIHGMLFYEQAKA